MKTVNRVTLLGAVGKDPEIRQTQDNLTVASFSLATSRKTKDKKELTEWHNCVAFGKLAEIVQQYVLKGSKLYLEGAISYSTYEKDGEKRYATRIVVDELSLLSSPGKNNPYSNPDTQKEDYSDSFDSEIPF